MIYILSILIGIVYIANSIQSTTAVVTTLATLNKLGVPIAPPTLKTYINDYNNKLCVKIHTTKKTNMPMYTCMNSNEYRNMDIDHCKKLPNTRHEYDLSSTDASSVFSFRDIFYSSTGFKISPTTLFMDNWYETTYYTDDKDKDIFLRYGLIVLKQVNKQHPPYNIDHQFDQHEDTREISLMEVIQKYGALEIPDNEVYEEEEAAAWKKIVYLKKNLYHVTKLLCFNQRGSAKTAQEQWKEIENEFSINGLSELIYFVKRRRDLINEVNRNRIKFISKDLIFNVKFLGHFGAKDDEKQRIKFDNIMLYLSETPITVSIAAPTYEKDLKEGKKIRLSDITVVGYSAEKDMFLVLDYSSSLKNVDHKNDFIWVNRVELISRAVKIKMIRNKTEEIETV